MRYPKHKSYGGSSDSDPNAHGRTRFIKRDIYRTAIASLVIFGISELFLRILIIAPSASISDPQLGWRYRANATILHSSEGYARNSLNRLGLNDEEILEHGTTRAIIAVGDSFTEALQVSQEFNFTSRAEQLSHCIDVLNAGRSGTTIVHYPLIVDRLFSEASFDDIVIVFTASDIADIEGANFQLIYDDQNTGIEEIVLAEKQLSELRQLFDPVFSRSSLASYLKNRIKLINLPPRDLSRPEESNEVSDERTREIERIFQFVFGEIKSRASTYALYIPNFEYLANKESKETGSSIVVSSIIQAAAESMNVPFVRADSLADSYRLTGKPPNGFPNNDIRRGHLNSIGHNLVAQTFVELIKATCTE